MSFLFSPLGGIFLYGLLVCLVRYWGYGSGLLLAASVAFLGFLRPDCILLLAGVSVAAYFGARELENEKAEDKTELLTLLVVLTFLPLVVFKVLNLFGVPLPLGLSFYTFHCASYLIDVARGTVGAERSASRLFLYISFFPQLVAGPITRAREVLPQLIHLVPPPEKEARRALWRIYLGFFKKFTIANWLGIWAKAAILQPGSFHWGALLLALPAGRYFVYADFSGYSDLAVGSAGLLGVRLPENFRRPFAARSIAQYWQRWHITLTSWIRDYVFYPLAATRFGAAVGLYPLLIITFLFIGSWHGFTVCFLLFGLWHGVLVSLHTAYAQPRRAVTGGWRDWAYPWCTFLFLVSPPTLFFFVPSLAGARAVVSAVLHGQGGSWLGEVTGFGAAVAAISIAALELYEWRAEREDVFERFERLAFPKQAALVLLALTWLGCAGRFTVSLDFLYFGF